ncbi:MAG: cupin domain-containing protein, partial [Lentisphaeria bacterium]|nr:cupin domain-containing protein [Lentisphaeria bacterium]
MKTVSLNNVAKIAADMDGAKGAWRQLPIGVADGTPTQSFRVFTLEPAGHTPCHTHEWEHLNYIIA